MVTGPDAVTPLENVWVDVYASSGGWVGSDFTAPDGSYEITGLAAGSYRVVFSPPMSSGYAWEYFDNTQEYFSATLVSVTAGATTPDINASLELGGAISGVVTGPDGVTPLEGVMVSAGPYGGMGSVGAPTAADGTYWITGLMGGSYRVYFSAPTSYVSEYYTNTTDYSSATPVSVVAGATTPGINASLELGGTISGVVTGPDGVTPLGGVSVYASPFSGPGGGGSATTLADGSYQITGLPAGSYRVQFSPPIGSSYMSEFYDNTTDYSSATPVSVVAGATIPGINASLALGATISGTVTGGSPVVPVNGATVEIYELIGPGFWGSSGQTATTQPDGTYELGGLAAGTYRIRFSAPGLAFEFYDDAFSAGNAADIVVAPGATVGGIDAVLAPGASISGSVTGPDGTTPVDGAYVEAFVETGGSWVSVASASAQTDGSYTLDSLPAGNYRVYFNGAWPSPYIAEWYDNAPDPNLADTVVVSAGVPVTGINASLALGGTISGTVTDAAGGTPLGYAYVYAYDDLGFPVGLAYTGFDGTYSVAGLPTGNYRVEFGYPGYAIEYYNDEVFFSAADPVAVSAGFETAGIDAALGPGARILGTVTGPDGVTPLSGVLVEALLFNGVDWEIISSRTTINDGTYQVGHLPAGSYVVQFSAPGYQTEYYYDAPDPGTGTPVPLTEGGTATGIDALLAVPHSTWVFVEDLAKTGPGAFEMFFAASANDWFQLQKSGTLMSWTNVGTPFEAVPVPGAPGMGTNNIPISTTEPKEFWRLVETGTPIL